MASLNEGRAKAARAYKAKWLLLPLSRLNCELKCKSMTEEAVKLKSDLRHTLTARARAEGREEKAREGLRVTEGELQEVRDGLQTAQNELRAAREELQTARDDLQVVREELQTARNEQWVVRGELRNKAVLLDRACYEASEAESSIERLADE